MYGKIGDLSGVPLSEKFPLTHNKPNFQSDNPKEGVWTDKPREPPKKQVWTPKPNFVRNLLDTLPKRNPPEIPQESFKQGAKRIAPPKPTPEPKGQHKNQNQPKGAPPKRYVCDYCHREGHLVEFCYRRLRAERREVEMRNKDRYYQGGRPVVETRHEDRRDHWPRRVGGGRGDHFPRGALGGGGCFADRAPGHC